MRKPWRVPFGLVCYLAIVACVSSPNVTQGQEQQVSVTVTQSASEVGADLRYEKPYTYTVKVDPWMFTIYVPGREFVPTSVVWMSFHEFEIQFDEPAHFGTAVLHAKQDEGGRWVARSPQLAVADGRFDGRHRYKIKIWPGLPDGKSTEADTEIEKQREQYYVVIDPRLHYRG